MRVIRKTVGGSSGSQRPFGIDNFTLLEANESEIVYGLAGRFWSLDYGLERFSDSEEFLAIKTPGSANWRLISQSAQTVPEKRSSRQKHA